MSIICWLFGHKRAVPMWVEDESTVHLKGCPRCGKGVGLPEIWKLIPPLQGMSKEKWKKLFNQYLQLKKEKHENIKS